MPLDYPDHHDAELVLKLYELRRETLMREARATLNAQLWPKTFADLADVFKSDHPLNASYRQVSSYWEMTYSMARYGIVHPDFLLESTGEGLFLFAKVHPFLAEVRAARSPRDFTNAEWIVTQTDLGKEMFARTSERVAKALAAR